MHTYPWAACSIVVKVLDLDTQGWWVNPWCGHDKICTAAQKALNPTLLQGEMSPASLTSLNIPFDRLG